MDLHAWITQRVDAAEDVARAADPTLAHVRSFIDDTNREIIATAVITTADVPAALRGPNWKP
ncbi:hypothetical protein [Streptomyces sp. SID8499]|uniref:hypothetical protein n=1 Tax=Streptomyces sp. SID8499 TaxID=2706106 RepID=UPI0013C720BC|nr:hypothetical protein [Streptomyces sp. SID8499]NED31099.1 hypothetical protein [Streptomyces sp. SID8499]